MPYIVSITQQGQITIPKIHRDRLNIGKNAKALIERNGNKLVITPIEDFFSLEGSIKPKSRPEDFKKMRKMFIDYLGKRALKK